MKAVEDRIFNTFSIECSSAWQRTGLWGAAWQLGRSQYECKQWLHRVCDRRQILGQDCELELRKNRSVGIAKGPSFICQERPLLAMDVRGRSEPSRKEGAWLKTIKHRWRIAPYRVLLHTHTSLGLVDGDGRWGVEIRSRQRSSLA